MSQTKMLASSLEFRAIADGVSWLQGCEVEAQRLVWPPRRLQGSGSETPRPLSFYRWEPEALRGALLKSGVETKLDFLTPSPAARPELSAGTLSQDYAASPTLPPASFLSVLPELQLRPPERPPAERLQQQHTGDLPEAPPLPAAPSLQPGVVDLDTHCLWVTFGLFVLACILALKIEFLITQVTYEPILPVIIIKILQ